MASCKEGCYCNAGFVLSGDRCVPVGDCGCVYQGKYYKKGDNFFPGASCQERCHCSDNGVVECQNVLCGAQEQCGVVNGIQGCHPISCGKCSLSGGSHYLTFDGHAFDFPGSCAYILAKVCSGDPELVRFSVVVENESSGNGKVVTKTIVITVHGYVISIGKGVNWKVLVSPFFWSDNVNEASKSICQYYITSCPHSTGNSETINVSYSEKTWEM